MNHNTLIYIMDPYCGWCYGNNMNLESLYSAYKDKIRFEILPGGLWASANKRILTEQLAEYIEQSDRRIEKTTGVKFGLLYFESLKNRSMVLDSEIPSRAIVTVNTHWMDKNVNFTIELQNQRYTNGANLNEDEVYEKIAAKVKLPVNDFMRFFNNNDMHEKTKEVFIHAAKLSKGYPAMLYIDHMGKSHVIEEGYTSLSMIEKKLNLLII